jgi:hypothetical protein
MGSISEHDYAMGNRIGKFVETRTIDRVEGVAMLRKAARQLPPNHSPPP